MDQLTLLTQYLPIEAVPIINCWIRDYDCQFVVARNRKTKLGDYRPPFRGRGHRISVNGSLNPYAFLLTTVHEFAHLLTWNTHQRKVKPHGAEWKTNFKQLMIPFLSLQILPDDVHKAIYLHLENPSASSCVDLHLFRTLQRYDQAPNEFIYVEDLASGSLFKTSNGRAFRKRDLLRKRYRCVDVKTGLIYLFNPLAEVLQLHENV